MSAAPAPEPTPAAPLELELAPMPALVFVHRVPYAGPEPQLVPPTLADFECRHGLIGACAACAATVTPRPNGG